VRPGLQAPRRLNLRRRCPGKKAEVRGRDRDPAVEEVRQINMRDLTGEEVRRVNLRDPAEEEVRLLALLLSGAPCTRSSWGSTGTEGSRRRISKEAAGICELWPRWRRAATVDPRWRRKEKVTSA
jgi:hypothetical protein